MSAPRRCRLGVTIKPPREKTRSDLDALAGMASTVFARVDKIRRSCPPTLNHEVSILDLAVFLLALMVMLLAWVGNGSQCVVTDGL